MLFSSLTFIFIFLPLTLIAYLLVRGRGKDFVLFLASLVFYAWGEPFYILLMLGTVSAHYFLALRLEKADTERKKNGLLALSLILSVGALTVFKYADFIVEILNGLGISLAKPELALPLGISFYTFQCISYIIDVKRGSVGAQHDFIRMGTYISMFPQLVAGPIVRYSDLEMKLNHPELRNADFDRGLQRFVLGLAKKVILANSLGALAANLDNLPAASVLSAWLTAIAFMLQIYFDFSAYSDMAIGLGYLLGFDFKENFNYPYTAQSITEFWRRWHISLGSWLRDYIYIPLGGNHVNKSRWILNLLIVWATTGIWHGAAYNFIIWGLFFFVFILLEKFLLEKIAGKLPSFVRRAYVLLVVCFSFVIFRTENLALLGRNLRLLTSIDHTLLSTPGTVFQLRQYLPLLLIAAIGATSLPRKLADKLHDLKSGKWVYEGLRTAVLLVLFSVSVAFLVDGSFNPFLYFRF